MRSMVVGASPEFRVCEGAVASAPPPPPFGRSPSPAPRCYAGEDKPRLYSDSPERRHQRVDLFLVGALGARVGTRTAGVAEEQHDLFGARRVGYADLDRVGGIEIPALVDRAVHQVDRSTG